MFISELSEYLKSKRGIDISLYKENFLQRRLSIHLNSNNIFNLSEYLQLIKKNDSELDRLIDLLTIHVTQFFRNPELFNELKNTVLPELFNRGSKTLCFLSAGCATGEEPYSLAMLLLEEFSDFLNTTSVKIYGVDISDSVLHRAYEGIYTGAALKKVPDVFRRKYFLNIGENRFRINEEVRKMVEFKKLNLFEEELQTKMDLVLCRNLLIYLNRNIQVLLIERLKNFLNENGYLILGKTEGIYTFMNIKELQVLSQTKRIYVLKGGSYA